VQRFLGVSENLKEKGISPSKVEITDRLALSRDPNAEIFKESR